VTSPFVSCLVGARRAGVWTGVAAVCFFIAFPASRSFSPVAPRNVRASKLITPLLLLRRPTLQSLPAAACTTTGALFLKCASEETNAPVIGARLKDKI